MSESAGRAAASDHLGELAELYALGCLTPPERADVEAHIAQCAPCTQALGAAETSVATLEAAFAPDREPPARLGARIAASAAAARSPRLPERLQRADRRPRIGLYATAASVLLAAGIGGGIAGERLVDDRQAVRDSAILATLATSHFNHVTFTNLDPHAPVSKALYARDGAWVYVVMAGPCHCRVVAHSATGSRELGEPAVRGTTATLFSRAVEHPTDLELRDISGHLVARATLVYSAR